MTENKIPEAAEIEAEVLGSMLTDADAFNEALETLKPESFYSDKNKIIFKTMVQLFDRNVPADIVTISEELSKKGLLEAVGGINYIVYLSESTFSSANIVHHCNILTEKRIARELQKKAMALLKEISTGDYEAVELQERTINNFENIFNETEYASGDISFGNELDTVLSGIEKRAFIDKDNGLKSSTLPGINIMTGGLRETDLVCILGDYKQGKSTVALQYALDIGIHEKIPVAVFSYEMDKETLYYKALSLRTGISYNKLRAPRENNLTHEEFESLCDEAKEVYSGSKIYFCDQALDKRRLKAKMKAWKRKLGIRLFVIDYLGLIPTPDKKERRDLEVADLSRFFKLTAKELKTPIIILSQANKEGKTAESRGPSRDADFVISVKKPADIGLKAGTINGKRFEFKDDHFLVTLDYSRHGRNGYCFICEYKDNTFEEIKSGSSPSKEKKPDKQFVEAELPF